MTKEVLTPRDQFRSIIEQAVKEEEVTYEEVMSNQRAARICKARRLAITRVREAFPSLAVGKLGRIFGIRDHRTVTYALSEQQRDVVRHRYVRHICVRLQGLNGDGI